MTLLTNFAPLSSKGGKCTFKVIIASYSLSRISLCNISWSARSKTVELLKCL